MKTIIALVLMFTMMSCYKTEISPMLYSDTVRCSDVLDYGTTLHVAIRLDVNHGNYVFHDHHPTKPLLYVFKFKFDMFDDGVNFGGAPTFPFDIVMRIFRKDGSFKDVLVSQQYGQYHTTIQFTYSQVDMFETGDMIDLILYSDIARPFHHLIIGNVTTNIIAVVEPK